MTALCIIAAILLLVAWLAYEVYHAPIINPPADLLEKTVTFYLRGKPGQGVVIAQDDEIVVIDHNGQMIVRNDFEVKAL